MIQTPVSSHAEVEYIVLSVISTVTGYEVAELNLDQELEHDLGIDSLKRLDILLGLGRKFRGLEQNLNELPAVTTIRDLVDLVVVETAARLDPGDPLEAIPPLGGDHPAAPRGDSRNDSGKTSGAADASGKAIGASVAGEDALGRVIRSVAELRNYEVEWLTPDLSLVDDLGLTEAERERLAGTLGLTFEVCAGPLRSVARQLDRPPDTHHATIIQTEIREWTLLIGVATPGAPNLTDWLLEALEASSNPLLEARDPDGTHAFAVVVDRARASWQADLRTALREAAGRSRPESNIWWSEAPLAALRTRKTAWLFPGSGSLYSGFLDELGGLSDHVSHLVAAARTAYAELAGRDLEFSAETDPLVQRPATVVASAAVASLLAELSVGPDAVAGHSVGELTACLVAGGLDLTELIRLTAAPFLGAEPHPQGRMLALLGPEEQTSAVLAESGCDVVVSNRNSRRQLVVSGSATAIRDVEQVAARRGIAAKLLDVEVPYHSPLLGPAHARLRKALDQANLKDTRIPIVSGLTADVLPWSGRDTAQTRALLDCAFIAPVNFVGQVERLEKLGVELLIDIGPTNRLERLARDTAGPNTLVLSASGSPHGSRHAFLSLLAQLHTLGQPVRVPQRITHVLEERPALLEPVAVVGLGGILPDAEDVDAFWRNLIAGHYAIRDLPQDAPHRWPIEIYYDPDPDASNKTASRIGAFAPEINFKPIQFRIPPHTAAHMDRAQKMALLAVRSAFADSGIDRSALDTTRVRVVIGTSVPEMQDVSRPRLVFDEVMDALQSSTVFSGLPEHVRAQIVAQAREVLDARYLAMTEDSLAGAIPNLVAGRVALCFDIRGGNVTLDAACASSLAAVDHAIKCLRLGEVDMVIAGGVDFAMSAASYVGFSKATALSSSGSTPFDSRADGFVMGEGAGILVLERLSDAKQGGRKIHAVIRGVGTSSDGNAKNITAPSVDGQVSAMRAALADSGIDPSSIGCIEAHGTSTVLGDVTEFQSLQRVFGAPGRTGPVYLGSVKANIGHLKAAAGIAGLIKAILAVQSGQVPPMPRFESPADGVDLENSPFVINPRVVSWSGRGLTPRRACVDSFGFGGVNYSAIVEQYVQEFYDSEAFQAELERSAPYQRHFARHRAHGGAPLTGLVPAESRPTLDPRPPLDMPQRETPPSGDPSGENGSTLDPRPTFDSRRREAPPARDPSGENGSTLDPRPLLDTPQREAPPTWDFSRENGLTLDPRPALDSPRREAPPARDPYGENGSTLDRRPALDSPLRAAPPTGDPSGENGSTLDSRPIIDSHRRAAPPSGDPSGENGSTLDPRPTLDPPRRAAFPTGDPSGEEIIDPQQAVRDIGQPLAVLDQGNGNLLLCAAPPASAAGLRGLVPAMRAEDLGAPGFRRAHGVRFNYVVGEMAGGIASTDMVTSAARSGMLAFFGSGGLDLSTIDARVCELRRQLPSTPFGVNLLHNPFDRTLEERTVDLLLRKDVRIASASAFMSVTPAVVRYRASGMRRGPDGGVIARNRVLAKVSSPRVAEQFMSPPSEEVLEALVAAGALSTEEASAAARVPVAEAVTGEGDSGGHTDRRPLAVLLPQLLTVREAVATRHDFSARGVELYIGAAGGIGDPVSMRAAFALGADYVVTGTINQTTLEAATSSRAKQMLAEAAMDDVAMAPAADMFELGAQVQVLKRGTLYAQRARQLYDLYRGYNCLEDIPSTDRDWLEREVFLQPLDEVWAATRRYWGERDPERLARAEADRKLRMALVFRAYLGLSSRWATGGDEARRSDYQVWCGPAIGLFNNWVQGTRLEPLGGRRVADVGLALLHGACVLTRLEQLTRSGYRLPLSRSMIAPPTAEMLRAVLL
jgi:PfaD family protein